MATGLDIIRDALLELGVYGAADTVSAEDSELGLSRLNDLLNEWNADKRAVYDETFTSYTLTPNLQPHTIGSSGATFTVTSRPVSIEAANIIDTSPTPDVTISQLTIVGADWWANQRVQALTSTIPQFLYYDAAWPNGNLYLWPVPTTAYTLQIWTRMLLSDLTLATTFTMPPAYKKAVTLTLAEELAAAFGVEVKPSTVEKARKARNKVFLNNTPTVSLQTRDAGMPRAGGTSYFDWRTGSIYYR